MITLMILTKNRSEFLIRALNYYVDVNYKHRIVIGDSSDSFHLERAKKAIDRLGKRINISYFEYPGIDVVIGMRQLLNRVSTPYAVISPDDDFLIPKALEQGINFLENHTDYSAVHGNAAKFCLKSSGACGDVAYFNTYSLRAIENETAANRLLNHLQRYSVTVFAVHRTSTWKMMVKDTDKALDKDFMGELLPGSLSTIYGKLKKLDCLYLVRQEHDRRYTWQRDTYDWITNENWHPSYAVFCGVLQQALMEKDGIGVEESREIVKRAFWTFLNSSCISRYQRSYGQKNSPAFYVRIKSAAKNIPMIKNRLLPMWRSIRDSRHRLFSPVNNMTFYALLSKSSPYHADFMPVYRAITTPPEEL